MERESGKQNKNFVQRRYGAARMEISELLHLSEELGKRYEETSGGQAHNSEWHEALEAFNALTDELRLLPQDDPVKALEFFKKLAESTDSFNREHVAAAIDGITKIDADLGVSLWTSLLEDHEGAVSDYAQHAIDRAIEDPDFPKEHLGVLAAKLADRLWFETRS